MATHPSHKDPFAKIVLMIGLVLILATVYVLVKNLSSTITRNSIDGKVDIDTLVANNATMLESKIKMIESKIKPIGAVTTTDGSGVVAAGPVRSGKEVYGAVCQACHSTGAAGAPKIDDKAAWKSRVAKGFDALMGVAIKGKGAMPARGGRNVSDAELKATIAYMTTAAGFNMDIPKDEAPAPKAVEKTEVATSAEASTETKKEKTEEATETVQKSETTQNSSTAAAPATSKKPAIQKPTTQKSTIETAKTEQKPAISGEKIYKDTCFACHAMGVAGSPKTGDKAVWEARIAKGNETLYTSAIKGIQSETGVMPPKGGKLSLSDDEVKAAVDYMVSQVK
ncbi:MAG: c-type cytochrome [Thiotrichaceae bacterium]